jgi:hypothetical protein
MHDCAARGAGCDAKEDVHIVMCHLYHGGAAVEVQVSKQEAA